MPTFEFTLTLQDTPEITDDLTDRLAAADCTDATVVCQDSEIRLYFARQAKTQVEAVDSAIADVTKAGYQIKEMEIGSVPCAALATKAKVRALVENIESAIIAHRVCEAECKAESLRGEISLWLEALEQFKVDFTPEWASLLHAIRVTVDMHAAAVFSYSQQQELHGSVIRLLAPLTNLQTLQRRLAAMVTVGLRVA